MFAMFRVGAGLALCLITVAAYTQQKIAIDWLVVLVVFFLSCFSMIWNDYHDRSIDKQSGKVWSYYHPKQTLYAAGVMALFSSFGVWHIFGQSRLQSIILGMILLGSIGYVYMQRQPVLKNVFVAVLSASLVLLPKIENVSVARVILFYYVFFLISSRELWKDIVDIEYDTGYKHTIPIALGLTRAQILAHAIFGAAMLFLVALNPLLGFLSTVFYVVGVLMWPSGQIVLVARKMVFMQSIILITCLMYFIILALA